jgi:hypothetical protein
MHGAGGWSATLYKFESSMNKRPQPIPNFAESVREPIPAYPSQRQSHSMFLFFLSFFPVVYDAPTTSSISTKQGFPSKSSTLEFLNHTGQKKAWTIEG